MVLLRLLAVEDGMSAAKVAKRLNLDQSRLRRLLSALGDYPDIGGLGLVSVQDDGRRQMLFLTDRGRALTEGDQ